MKLGKDIYEQASPSIINRNSRLFVEKENAGASLEKSVGGREASETTTDDDDLSH